MVKEDTPSRAVEYNTVRTFCISTQIILVPHPELLYKIAVYTLRNLIKADYQGNFPETCCKFVDHMKPERTGVGKKIGKHRSKTEIVLLLFKSIKREPGKFSSLDQILYQLKSSRPLKLTMDCQVKQSRDYELNQEYSHPKSLYLQRSSQGSKTSSWKPCSPQTQRHKLYNQRSPSCQQHTLQNLSFLNSVNKNQYYLRVRNIFI